MRALVVAFLLLAGCSRGPDEAALRRDVEARLAQALPPGTLTLAVLERRGSQSDTKAPAGETRRVVYFDAAMTLERDFDFGAWDAPGVAGLVSALGAGPKGIAGIRSGGNRAGDVLTAHGTALYARDGDGWSPVTSGGYQPAAAPAYATSAAEGPHAILDAMRRVIESTPAGAAPAQREAIEEELRAAHAAIVGRLARLADGYAIAAGPEHGQYLRLARALSGGSGVRTVPLVTRGGDDNVRLLREGKAALALAQGDAALEAYEGTGNFAGDGPYRTLRAIGSLYPEPVHVLVRADSRFRSIGDLRGRRVAIGVDGSASRATALRVLVAHALGPPAVVPLDLALADGLVALRDGHADAVVQVIGVPADSVRAALAEVPLRLLPLSEDAVADLVRANLGYVPYTVPRGAYPTQPTEVRTVATAALLLAGGGLSDTEVAGITRYVFQDSRDFALRGSAQGTQISVGTARLGLSIPLHEAAARTLDAIAAK